MHSEARAGRYISRQLPGRVQQRQLAKASDQLNSLLASRPPGPEHYCRRVTLDCQAEDGHKSSRGMEHLFRSEYKSSGMAVDSHWLAFSHRNKLI